MRATTTVTTSSPPSWRITSAITPEPWARPDGGPVRDAHGRSCEPGNHRARGAIRLPERGAGFDPPVPRRSPAGPHYAQRLEAVRHLAEHNAHRLLGALGFLGLIDDAGRSTGYFERLRRASAEEYLAALADVLRAAYHPVFEAVDP